MVAAPANEQSSQVSNGKGGKRKRNPRKRANRKKGGNFTLDDVNKLRNQTQTVGASSYYTVSVSDCKALYRVDSVEKAVAHLEAVHVEVFEDGRDDLKRIRYDANTVGALDGSKKRRLTADELYPGDVVIVYGLKSETVAKEKGKPIRSWTITSCDIRQRTFLRDQLSVVACRRRHCTKVMLSIEGSKQLVVADTVRFPITLEDAFFMIDVFVPSQLSRCFLTKPKDDIERNTQNLRLIDLSYSHFPPQLHSIEPADQMFREAFVDDRYPGDKQEMAVTMYRRFGVSVPAQGALEAESSNGAFMPHAVIAVERSNDTSTSFCFSDYSHSQDYWKVKGQVDIATKTIEKSATDELTERMGSLKISECANGTTKDGDDEDSFYSGFIQRVIKYNKGGRRVIFELRGRAGKALAAKIKKNKTLRFEVRQIDPNAGILEDHFIYEDFMKLYSKTGKLRKEPYFYRIISALHQKDERLADLTNFPIISSDKVVVAGKNLVLNPEQHAAVGAILNLDEASPAMAMTAAFGSGKTFVISIANSRLCEYTGEKDIHVVVAQSNNAVANAVEAADRVDGPPILRVISKQNYDTKDRTTDSDLPVMLRKFFTDPMTRKKLSQAQIAEVDKVLDEMHKPYRAVRQMMTAKQYKEIEERNKRYNNVVRLFCTLYKPRRIFATTASFLGSFRNIGVWSTKDVKSIIIDEASQLSEAMFFALITTFTQARIVLVGDDKQLPPYCPVGVTSLLRHLTTGNLFNRVISEKLFPVFPLQGIYRCHPKITNILSSIFYSGNLVPRVTDAERGSSLRRLKMRNPKEPMIFLDVDGIQERVGTSWRNQKELAFIVKLAERLVNNRSFRCSEIAILSLYKPQMEAISDACYDSKVLRDVFVGTVDSAQGKEWTLTIVSTVRTSSMQNSDFFSDSKRANVALSRAKEACIVVGHKKFMSNLALWEDIIPAMHVEDAKDFLAVNGS